MASVSLVAADSSHFTLWPDKNIPSQGMISPGSRRARSPRQLPVHVLEVQSILVVWTYFDIDDVFHIITDNLYAAFFLLLIECLELALLLLVVY